MSPLLITALAFIAFALLHSLTASDFFKRLVSRIFGRERTERYYRPAFNLFSAIITSAAAYVILSQPDRLVYRPPWYVLWPAHAVQLSGVLLFLAALRPFDFGSFIGTGPQPKKGELITTGAYGLVRHPMYLAGMLVLVFEPNITENCLAVTGLGTAYFIYGALAEERRLMKEYGGQYREYKKRVPMFNIIKGTISITKRRRDV